MVACLMSFASAAFVLAFLWLMVSSFLLLLFFFPCFFFLSFFEVSCTPLCVLNQNTRTIHPRLVSRTQKSFAQHTHTHTRTHTHTNAKSVGFGFITRSSNQLTCETTQVSPTQLTKQLKHNKKATKATKKKKKKTIGPPAAQKSDQHNSLETTKTVQPSVSNRHKSGKQRLPTQQQTPCAKHGEKKKKKEKKEGKKAWEQLW